MSDFVIYYENNNFIRNGSPNERNNYCDSTVTYKNMPAQSICLFIYYLTPPTWSIRSWAIYKQIDAQNDFVLYYVKIILAFYVYSDFM